uniref:Uncharacterized protein n=1 Tax=Physcomitrium patens TaxID=3218 RepID=A0A2K1JSJ8_PHYPA|nr:hypothetical protein PHYPA_016790 [Physcomitrium patens]
MQTEDDQLKGNCGQATDMNGHNDAIAFRNQASVTVDIEFRRINCLHMTYLHLYNCTPAGG